MSEFVLVVEGGPAAGSEVALAAGEIASIGRALDARVRLSEDDKKVSRYHAVLEVRADGIVARDLSSRNGTFVNEARIDRAILRETDRLRIGRTTMRIRRAVPVQAPEPSTTEAEDDLPLLGDDTTETSDAPRANVPLVDALCNVCGLTTPMPASPWPGARILCVRCADARRALATHPADRATIGAFAVVRFLAQGGMGSVYEARHVGFGAHAAIKVLRADSPQAATFQRRFINEQRTVLRLRHPHIVGAFDARIDARSGEPFIATEFVMGGDAEAISSPACDARVATEIGADVFEALAYGHSQGFLHRDVKPANVLLLQDAAGHTRAKLGDFGLAKSFMEAGGTSITAAGESAGSLFFMAPEQLLDFKRVGTSADLYGAGATLFWLLTGRSPLIMPVPDASVTMSIACAAMLDNARVPVRTLRPDLPPALASWIDGLVARDPGMRAAMPASQVASALRALTRA